LDSQFPAERIIATWDPVANAGTPFEWNGSASITGISTATVLGQDLETFVPDTSGSDVLTYLRGSSALEQRNSGSMRNRTHKLGDIVNSNPLYIGAPSGSSQLASYTAFANANAGRTPVLYVGANDGMLHAFNATTTGGGNELFAYIPRGVYANLINLVSPYYNARHQFFVNGSPQASDVQFADSSWHTELVSAEQAGGNSIFAIDVTNPAALTTEAQLAQKVLWDFTDPDMGLTYSTPSIAQTSDVAATWQVFVGNGYNSRFQKPFLYALNAQTGAIITKIDLCAAVPTACNLAASNGLSTVIAVNGGGQVSGAVTLVYGGDLQGNLWRINVSNANPLNWTVSVSFQARDSLGHPQPITTTPAATLNPRYPQVLGTMVFVGTGELLGIPDLSNFQTESIYGIYDPPNGYTTPLNRFTASMVQQSIADASLDGTTVRLVTGNAVSIPTNSGWYMDLDAITGGTFTASASGVVTISGGTVTGQGERVITDPRIESGGALVLTTYEPTDNLCSAGGSSFLMVLNYASGGSFPSPQFSVNGSVTINATDSLSVSNGSGSTILVNPIGLSLGSVYAAAPTIQNANFATASKIKLITESTGAIQTVAEKGSSKNRTAWWEIRQ
jgi:type IV pilus assembly protein PilY1